MLDIKDYAKDLDAILSSGSAEQELIVEVYNTLLRALPITPQAAQADLSVLETLKPQLSALTYSLNTKINEKRLNYDARYFSEYTTASKFKNAHAAIEAFLFNKNPDLLTLKYVIVNYDNTLEFVKSLLFTLNDKRQSILKAWTDARL